MTYVFSKGAEEFARESKAVVDLLRHLRSHPAHDLTLSSEAREEGVWVCELKAADLLPGKGVLTVFTSGTTGVPKPNRHALSRLFSKPSSGEPSDNWLLCYSPFRWAGLSVIAHTINIGASLKIPDSTTPVDLIGAIRDVTHVSLTPSLFRKLVIADVDLLSQAPLRQITFGGEWAGQAVLDLCREIFPATRITHLYASSELGDVCAVSDGGAGYPREKLGEHALLSTGELVLRGHRTGDFWKEREGRLYFLGRGAEHINVGGTLIAATTVEEAALCHPAVMQAQAYPLPSPLLGQIVGLRYIGAPSVDEMRFFLRERLPKVAVPMKYEKVAEILLTESSKLARTI